MKKLSKEEMKTVMGGVEEFQEPGGDGGECGGCQRFCHQVPGDYTGNGKCKVDSPPTCRNYCCENGQPTRWC